MSPFCPSTVFWLFGTTNFQIHPTKFIDERWFELLSCIFIYNHNWICDKSIIQIILLIQYQKNILLNLPEAERLRRAYPALPGRAGVGSIPANSNALNVPFFSPLAIWNEAYSLFFILNQIIDFNDEIRSIKDNHKSNNFPF